MRELQQCVSVSCNVARVGYHEGPAELSRLYNPCSSYREAYQRLRQEFPDDTYDVWDVVYEDHMVAKQEQST